MVCGLLTLHSNSLTATQFKGHLVLKDDDAAAQVLPAPWQGGSGGLGAIVGSRANAKPIMMRRFPNNEGSPFWESLLLGSSRIWVCFWGPHFWKPLCLSQRLIRKASSVKKTADFLRQVWRLQLHSCAQLSWPCSTTQTQAKARRSN